MADLALGVIKDVIKTGMALKEAVDTVSQNKEDCQDIQVLVGALIPILCRLHNMGFTSHPPMCSALMALNRSLHRALKLVNKCQKRNAMLRFLTAADMAKELRRVHHDIQLKMQLGNLAITTSMMEVTIEITKTTIIERDGTLPPSIQPLLGAAEMELHSRHSATGNARSEENNAGTITMMTTGTQTPFAHSFINNITLSGSTESACEMVATLHVSENIKKESINRKIRAQAYNIRAAFRFKEGGVLNSQRITDHEFFKELDAAQHKPVNKWMSISRWFLQGRIARWMSPRARGSASLPPPPLPLRVEDKDAEAHSSHLVNAATLPAQLSQALLPATTSEEELLFATTHPSLILQHQKMAPTAAARASVALRRRPEFTGEPSCLHGATIQE